MPRQGWAPEGTPIRERLALRTAIRPSGCWEWTGSLNPKGYSQINVGGKVLRAHRVSYEMHVGPIPDGMQLDHLCRNRKCINPAHLEPVTNAENARRRLVTPKSQCVRGHAMTGPNVYQRPRSLFRECRTCRRELQRKTQ